MPDHQEKIEPFCTAAIIAPVPDSQRVFDASVVIQCERKPGHPGAHWNDSRILWPRPDEEIKESREKNQLSD